MKCDEFLSAMETGGFVQRLKARCHAARCQRCASEQAAFADAMQRWAAPEPLSPHAERLWRQAAGEATARPARGNAWKLATAGAVAGVCLIVICLLAVSQHIQQFTSPCDHNRLLLGTNLDISAPSRSRKSTPQKDSRIWRTKFDDSMSN